MYSNFSIMGSGALEKSEPGKLPPPTPTHAPLKYVQSRPAAVWLLKEVAGGDCQKQEPAQKWWLCEGDVGGF